MARIRSLEKSFAEVPPSVLLKADLLFTGIRPNVTLISAAIRSQPHFQTVIFEGGRKTIPYFLSFEDMTTPGKELFVLVRPVENSPYHVEPAEKVDTFLLCDEHDTICPIRFVPLPAWYMWAERESLTRATAGMSQHGDMLVVNMSPACEYWPAAGDAQVEVNQWRSHGSFFENGTDYACHFCGYGAMSQRARHLGQRRGVPDIPAETLGEFRRAVHRSRTETRHLFLVGGSMRDRDAEGERYLQLTRAAIQAEPSYRGLIGCGSQALSKAWSQTIRNAGAGYACYNLEVWDEELWTRTCPGKARFVGRDEWLQGLLDAVEVFGRGAVFSAFVTGVELVSPPGFSSTDEALRSNLDGAEWLLSHGIIPIHSPFSPAPNSSFRSAAAPSLDYFLCLNVETRRLRRQHNLAVDTRYICSGCTYGQIECDLDRSE
ncbi:MAG: hypothetical protein ACUVWX_03230 [Kiritimatiellia bacterium]